MARASEIKYCFENILSENESAIRDLEQTLLQIGRDRKPTDEALDQVIQNFAHALFEPLDRSNLDRLSAATGYQKGFLQSFQQQLAASQKAKEDFDSLTAQNGKQSDLQKNLTAADRSLRDLQAQVKTLKSKVYRSADILKPVIHFNQQAQNHVQPGLDDLSYFHGRGFLGHVWNVCFNSHYRQGRNVLATFAQSGAGQSIPDFTKAYEADNKFLSTLENNTIQSANVFNSLKQKVDAIKAAAAGIRSESAIIDSVVNDIIKTMQNNQNFDRVATVMRDIFPSYGVELRAKQRAFDQMQARATQSIQSLKSAGNKLETPLRDISKAARRSSSQSVTIDLEGIRATYDRVQHCAQNLSANTRKASSNVRDYKMADSRRAAAYTDNYSSSGLSTTDLLVGFMIYDMLSNPATQDVATLAASAQDLNTLKSDVESFMPATGVSTDLSDAFNGVDVTVPDISIPADINMPDFSIPDMSSFDSGSSSSGSDYSSGGYDSGGSFDGGGGGGGGDCGGGGGD